MKYQRPLVARRRPLVLMAITQSYCEATGGTWHGDGGCAYQVP